MPPRQPAPTPAGGHLAGLCDAHVCLPAHRSGLAPAAGRSAPTVVIAFDRHRATGPVTSYGDEMYCALRGRWQERKGQAPNKSEELAGIIRAISGHLVRRLVGEKLEGIN
jgi:hypothetical protein